MSERIPVLPGFEAHYSGAMLLPETRTAVVADAHLGYGWAQRRRGELGPLADEATKQKLLALVAEAAPARIVFLGDLVHAPKPCAEERLWIENLVGSLAQRAELISVRGNHDRAFAREFAHLPIRTLDTWSEGRIVAIHGDRIPELVSNAHTLLMGHIHPSLPVHDAAGAGRKLPVFLSTAACVLLPAFSPFAGGYDLLCGLPAEVLPLFGTEPIQAFAITGKRVAALGDLSRVIDRMLEQERGTPAQFRRRLTRIQNTTSGR